ncbi:MAG: response regulator [Proteobacteria bacterium]|nr:response regulator [Pseudomonadota bacterium]MBU1709189.1 response regulator [Pseudomonadota bacterium]
MTAKKNTIKTRDASCLPKHDTVKYQKQYAELKEADDQKQFLLNSSRESIMLLDRDLNVTWANSTALDPMALKLEEIIGSPCFKVFAGKNKPCRGCPCPDALNDDSIKNSIIWYPDKRTNIDSCWDHWAVPVKNDTGEITHIAVTARNITEKAKLQDELHYNEQFRNIITSISTQFISLSTDKIDKGINQALQTIGKFSGVDRAYVFQFTDDSKKIISNTHEWCAPGIAPQIDILKQLQASSFPWIFEQLSKIESIHIPDVSSLPPEADAEKNKYQSLGIQSLNNIPMVSGDNFIGFIGFDSVRIRKTWSTGTIDLLKIVAGVFSNILERKRREEKIQQSEEQLKLAMDATGLGMWNINLTSGKGFIDDQGASIFGYQPGEIGNNIKSWEKLLHPNDKNRILDALSVHLEGNTSFLESEIRVLTKSEEYQWIFISGKITDWDQQGMPLRIMGTYRDITKQKKDEKDLRMSQKMEAIGTLAGGISHNFNNILTGIIGYAKLATFHTSEDNPIHNHMQEIIKASKRAARLVEQIQTFSRQSEQEKKPLLLQPLIKESLKMLRGALPTTIQINQNISADCGPVFADVSQMHQVIMNLCTNAYGAMREKSGVLEVGLEKVEITANSLSKYPDLPVGHYCCLTFKDNGHGMDRKTIDRIFEPYFTTKNGDEGIGLGLATVHGIVTAGGGAVSVKSKPEKGSTFNVYWPLIPMPSSIKNDSKKMHLPTISKHILFVDDEEMLVALGELILKQIGCAVTSTCSSQEALKLFADDPLKFDMLITDLTMPGMTGLDLSKEVLKIRPEMPIILSSGYNEDVNRAKAMEVGVRQFVKKPLAIEDMTETIWMVLSNKN